MKKADFEKRLNISITVLTPLTLTHDSPQYGKIFDDITYWEDFE